MSWYEIMVHLSNSDLEKEIANHRAALRAALTEYVNRRRAKLSCRDCGLKKGEYGVGRPEILLHHPEGDGDHCRYSDLISACATIDEIEAEIARCIPLCWKCHGAEHARMRREAELIN